MIHKKRKVTAGEIQATLEMLASAKIKEREPSFNLIYLNTKAGQIKIKTNLSLKDWLKSQNLKPKKRK
jgi:hypothetical protein